MRRRPATISCRDTQTGGRVPALRPMHDARPMTRGPRTRCGGAPASQPASAIAARWRRLRFSRPTFQPSIPLAITPTSGVPSKPADATERRRRPDFRPALSHLLHPHSCNSFVYTNVRQLTYFETPARPGLIVRATHLFREPGPARSHCSFCGSPYSSSLAGNICGGVLR